LAAPFLTAIDGVARSGALDSRVSSSSFYFFSPFLFLLCFKRLVAEDLGETNPQSGGSARDRSGWGTGGS
jgi:hypothetical protein